ncbi:MAG: methyl-accepting chemotaxis protein [Treponema sp.]|nr:methyl-accepting chemotaxis protein [Treponema sp.]
MKQKVAFLLLIVGASFAAVAGIFAVLYLFSSGEIPFGTMLARYVLPALVCVAATSLFLGKNALLFSSPDFTDKGEKLFKLLKKLGAVPIKSIGFFVLLQMAFLVVVVIALGKSFGVPQAMQGYLFCACLAAGMALGTLVYVASDGLVSQALMAYNVMLYPRDLREDRQSLKILIIPLAVTVLSVIFTFSITVLSLSKEGVDIAALHKGGWTITILVMAVFILFITALAVILKKNSTALFHTIIAQLENLSSGKKDLRRRINIISVDELGSIAGMMNSFSQTIASGMGEIKADQEKLFVSSGQLEDNAQEMNTAVGSISAAIAQAREKAGSQLLSVEQASAVIRSITQNIESLNGSITTQSESVGEASSAVEEMVGNIASIGKVTEKMADHFKTVHNAANEGLAIQKDSSQRVEQIVAQSQALQAANRIIATISSQTNLLAMNAAIEAAHAGAAGQGFSVVADEIRKLAETASVESKKINEELKQITKTIDGIVKGAQSSAGAFNAVSARVGETENLVNEVNSAIKEQQVGAEQILEALKRMNTITAEVKAGSMAMQEGNNTMLNEIGSLQNHSKDISSGMEKITREINTVNTGAAAVSKLAGDTHGAVEKIKNILNGYEV